MPSKLVSPVHVRVQAGRHTFACEGGVLGRLACTRRSARFEPTDGPPFLLRREPGITASHYQMWNEKDSRPTEFFASSYRWSLRSREIRVHYGNNDYRLVPSAGFGRGCDLVDLKGRSILRIAPRGSFGRGVEITIDKAETELPCIVFAYFLARTIWLRSFFPKKGASKVESKAAPMDAATQQAANKAAELARAMMPGGSQPAAEGRSPSPGSTPPAGDGTPTKPASQAASR
jgi:hypothetical protein